MCDAGGGAQTGTGGVRERAAGPEPARARRDRRNPPRDRPDPAGHRPPGVLGRRPPRSPGQTSPGPGGETYGTRLARDLGATPVYVRYNSGRHVSENGRSIDELLEALVAAWPVEVGRIALVGHSMGGLVARSAAYEGARAGRRWSG